MQKCYEGMCQERDRLRSKYGEDCPSVTAMSDTAQYAQKHMDVIERWGRFPHRNEILDRKSSPEEKQGLQDGTVASF